MILLPSPSLVIIGVVGGYVSTIYWSHPLWVEREQLFPRGIHDKAVGSWNANSQAFDKRWRSQVANVAKVHPSSLMTSDMSCEMFMFFWSKCISNRNLLDLLKVEGHSSVFYVAQGYGMTLSGQGLHSMFFEVYQLCKNTWCMLLWFHLDLQGRPCITWLHYCG